MVPANITQSSAILGLVGGLEAVQGPSGTGQSTTVFHVINSRVPPKEKVWRVKVPHARGPLQGVRLYGPLQVQAAWASTGSGCMGLYRVRLHGPLQGQAAGQECTFVGKA